MVMSWIRAGLVAGFAVCAVLLLRGLFAEGAPHVRDVAFAGGLYTMAFALRVTL
jgi:hypothetical protein